MCKDKTGKTMFHFAESTNFVTKHTVMWYLSAKVHCIALKYKCILTESTSSSVYGWNFSYFLDLIIYMKPLKMKSEY